MLLASAVVNAAAAPQIGHGREQSGGAGKQSRKTAKGGATTRKTAAPLKEKDGVANEGKA